MPVTDWRAWTAQNGGSQPGQTSPVLFPGIQPITDLIDGTLSIPPYPNAPTAAPARDPWAGWTAQQETTAKTMRPPVIGVTS